MSKKTGWQKWTPSLTMKEAMRITGQGFAVIMPWESCFSAELGEWLSVISGSKNTAQEYVLFSALPAISALVGPATQVNVNGMGWQEPLNIASIILGTSRSGKSPAYDLTVSPVKRLKRHASQEIVQEEFTMKGLSAHLGEHARVLIAPEEGDQFIGPVVKSTSFGATDRSAYNKMMDGKACKNLCASRGSKSVKVETPPSSVGIVAFHWAEIFLKDQALELQQRRDGFLGRMLLVCPRPRGEDSEMVETHNTALKQYPESLQHFDSLYDIIDAKHEGKGITYTFSEEAQEARKLLADEEIRKCDEDWGNMADGLDIDLKEYIVGEFKLDRILPRVAALLHILELVFNMLIKEEVDPNDNVTFLDLQDQVNTKEWPSVIDISTYRRAEEVMNHLVQVRKTILSPILDLLKAPEDKPKDPKTKMRQNVLLKAPGVLVNIRAACKAFSSGMNMTKEKLEPLLTEMADDGLGQWYEEGKNCGFVKAYPLTQEQLTALDIKEADYTKSCAKPTKDGIMSVALKDWLLAMGGQIVYNTVHGIERTEEEDANKESDEVKEVPVDVEAGDNSPARSSGRNTSKRSYANQTTKPATKRGRSRREKKN